MKNGWYFDDINNKSGEYRYEVSAGLTNLMMITRSAVPKNEKVATWQEKQVLVTLKKPRPF